MTVGVLQKNIMCKSKRQIKYIIIFAFLCSFGNYSCLNLSFLWSLSFLLFFTSCKKAATWNLPICMLCVAHPTFISAGFKLQCFCMRWRTTGSLTEADSTRKSQMIWHLTLTLKWGMGQDSSLLCLLIQGISHKVDQTKKTLQKD